MVVCAFAQQVSRVVLRSADDTMSDTGDDGTGWSDMDFDVDNNPESADLLQAPRKVEKITVSYSKASKQVRCPAHAVHCGVTYAPATSALHPQAALSCNTMPDKTCSIL